MLHFFKIIQKIPHYLTPVCQKSWWYDLQFLRYIEHQGLKLVILGHFLPFHSPKNQKDQHFEKMEKLLEVSWFYRCVPKITIIRCNVPEIWSETDRIFCHFGPFFALKNPLIISKIKILKKWKKCLEILSFHTCAS